MAKSPEKSEREMPAEYRAMGASVEKFRRLATKAGSVAEMPVSERKAYGAAVIKAVLAKHRAMLPAPLARPEPAPSGAKVLAAIRASHSRALSGALEASWAKPGRAAYVEAAYLAVMAEKRKREEAAAEAARPALYAVAA